MRLVFDELPQMFPGDRIWGTRCGKWSFVISEIGGEWSASWANHDPTTMPPGGRALTTRIDEPFSFRNFKEAVAACERTLSELQRAA